MSEPTPAAPAPAPAPAVVAPKPKPEEAPPSIRLYSYPKVAFLYPALLVALVAAIWASFLEQPLAADNSQAVFLGSAFLIALGLNMVVLAFDFPRATSLTLFFFAVAVVLGLVLLFRMKPEWLPALAALLESIRPVANAHFYWTFAAILGSVLGVALLMLPFDYWEVRRNELLHHHGILSNLERFPAPNLRIDKEINDVFEYILLGSGRLILQISSERRAIILDNVPFIRRKEAILTRMLGTLHVEVQHEEEDVPH